MPQKKQNKKTQTKKLGTDPTLKPRVVETKSTLTEEEQNENPLGRMKEPKLPKGFKTADNLTEKDDLEFECGRLREMLATWLDILTVEGVTYNVLVDPMNRQVELTRSVI